MEIKTGYFANWRKYQNEGYEMIGIVRYVPSYFNGKNLINLAPSVELLNDYKKGLINEDNFREVYNSYLEENFNLVYSDLANLNLDKIVLCCFEKPDKFCHRHILADFLNAKLNLNIKEF